MIEGDFQKEETDKADEESVPVKDIIETVQGIATEIHNINQNNINETKEKE